MSSPIATFPPIAAKKFTNPKKKKDHVENDSVEVTNDEQEPSPKKKNSVKN